VRPRLCARAAVQGLGRGPRLSHWRTKPEPALGRFLSNVEGPLLSFMSAGKLDRLTMSSNRVSSMPKLNTKMIYVAGRIVCAR
jgi:hypothetical protein